MVGTPTLTHVDPARATRRITLQGIHWQTYIQLLTELGDQRATRLAYAHEVLEITMPSDRHEAQKKLLERMIETFTEELNVPVKGFGSTTLNRADLEHGAEPDSCYYIQHVSAITGRQVDLNTDPPPDLVLEIDISSPSGRRLDIYQQLGVPEAWRYSAGYLQLYRLDDGVYVPCDRSLSFPLRASADPNHFLQQAETQDYTAFIRSWRQWIHQQLASFA